MRASDQPRTLPSAENFRTRVTLSQQLKRKAEAVFKTSAVDAVDGSSTSIQRPYDGGYSGTAKGPLMKHFSRVSARLATSAPAQLSDFLPSGRFRVC
jgi:glutamine amidotransferase-like uncharacterized protein